MSDPKAKRPPQQATQPASAATSNPSSSSASASYGASPFGGQPTASAQTSDDAQGTPVVVVHQGTPQQNASMSLVHGMQLVCALIIIVTSSYLLSIQKFGAEPPLITYSIVVGSCYIFCGYIGFWTNQIPLTLAVSVDLFGGVLSAVGAAFWLTAVYTVPCVSAQGELTDLGMGKLYNCSLLNGGCLPADGVHAYPYCGAVMQSSNKTADSNWTIYDAQEALYQNCKAGFAGGYTMFVGGVVSIFMAGFTYGMARRRMRIAVKKNQKTLVGEKQKVVDHEKEREKLMLSKYQAEQKLDKEKKRIAEFDMQNPPATTGTAGPPTKAFTNR